MSGRIWATAVFCSVFALLHCGGSVAITGGSGGAAGHAGRGHAGSAGHASMAGAGGAGAASSDAGLDVYVDPGCPDLGPPVSVNECDAYSPTPSCPPDQGCYPFVNQPFGAGCGAQSFGTECRAAGTGRQGDGCGGGQGGCATGFVCVVGAQPGKHCVQLCPVGSQHTCPAGLICGELDVEGYGVCS
jgi:hypothetical protein